MGLAHGKLWDAVEEGNVSLLKEVLLHKETDVNHTKSFRRIEGELMPLPTQGDQHERLTKQEKLKMKASHVIKGTSGRERDKDEFTPLHYACERGDRDIVHLLLEYGANKDLKAVHERHDEQGLGSDSGEFGVTTSEIGYEYLKYAQYTPIYYACHNKHTSIVMDLLFHDNEPLKLMTSDDNLRHLNEEEQKNYWKCIDEVVSLLILYEADLASCLCSLSSRNNALKVAEILVKLGASVNGEKGPWVEKLVMERKPALVLNQYKELYPKDIPNESRPLYRAIRAGNKEMVAFLLNYGATVSDDDVNLAIEILSPKDLVQMLLDKQIQKKNAPKRMTTPNVPTHQPSNDIQLTVSASDIPFGPPKTGEYSDNFQPAYSRPHRRSKSWGDSETFVGQQAPQQPQQPQQPQRPHQPQQNYALNSPPYQQQQHLQQPLQPSVTSGYPSQLSPSRQQQQNTYHQQPIYPNISSLSLHQTQSPQQLLSNSYNPYAAQQPQHQQQPVQQYGDPRLNASHGNILSNQQQYAPPPPQRQHVQQNIPIQQNIPLQHQQQHQQAIQAHMQQQYYNQSPPGLPPRRHLQAPLQPQNMYNGSQPLTPQPLSPQHSPTSNNDDSWEVDYNELVLEKEIARGSFGVIYAGKFRGTEVAIKKLINQNLTDKQLKEFNAEIIIMKKLHHPNVLLLMGVVTVPPNLCIIMELLEGSLWDLLHKSTNVRVDWKLALSMIIGTAKGMNYLHLSKPPILHRDLKTPNLLVDKHFQVKICDFGLSRLKAQFMTGNLGTPQYMAPEVIKSETYTEKADVYSFAIVMWEITTRQIPFRNMKPMQVAFAVTNNGMRPPVPMTIPPLMQNLMVECWQQDPRLRPSFSDILRQLQLLTH